MLNTPKSKFPELLQLKLPCGAKAALGRLANKHHRTKSELARQAILREIISGGLSIDEPLLPEDHA